MPSLIPSRTRYRATNLGSSIFPRQTQCHRRVNSVESTPARTSSIVSKVQDALMRRQRKITNWLSYLDPKNPLPVSVSSDDVVWLMDNVAFQGPGGVWQAEFVAAVFDHKPSPKAVDIVGDIASKLGFSKGDKEEKTIEWRVAPFMMEVLPGRCVRVNFENLVQLDLGPGGRNGISSDIKQLPHNFSHLVARSVADVPRGVTGMLEMKTLFAEPEGWAIISDIDDTIKITQTDDPAGILRTTFVSEPTPVDGMPELYTYLRNLLPPSAPFFYLSASPYNLYPLLRDFRDKYFPYGQLILRDTSWITVSGLLETLTVGTETFKVNRIKKIRQWFPRRKIICIGDSTQSDPEAYGVISRLFPGWIRLILIRRVTGIAAAGLEEKNAPERFERAFASLPREMWHVFEDPAECWSLIHNTIKAE